jgi:hypothetical protein
MCGQLETRESADELFRLRRQGKSGKIRLTPTGEAGDPHDRRFGRARRGQKCEALRFDMQPTCQVVAPEAVVCGFRERGRYNVVPKR